MKQLDLPTDKLYFTIGEVAEIFNVNTSLIRYWEQEFEQLHPHKNRKGDRRFVKKDIETLLTIYILVKEKGFTIEGAKKALTEDSASTFKRELLKKLLEIKNELLKLKNQI